MSKEEIELLLIPTEEELKHEEEMILFAEFLGYEKGNWLRDEEIFNSSNESYWVRRPSPDSYQINDDGVYPGEMRFKESWDWLMKVVEKIETISHPKYPEYKSCIEIGRDWTTLQWEHGTMGIEGTFLSHAENKLIRTYEVCLKFIKWYNSIMEKK
jgi:hypothetical protein